MKVFDDFSIELDQHWDISVEVEKSMLIELIYRIFPID